jgi:hypothetical protein
MSRQLHPKTQELLAKLKAKKEADQPKVIVLNKDCVACEGKGVNSRGDVCHPCLMYGRIKC